MSAGCVNKCSLANSSALPGKNMPTLHWQCPDERTSCYSVTFEKEKKNSVRGEPPLSCSALHPSMSPQVRVILPGSPTFHLLYSSPDTGAALAVPPSSHSSLFPSLWCLFAAPSSGWYPHTCSRHGLAGATGMEGKSERFFIKRHGVNHTREIEIYQTEEGKWVRRTV